MVPVGVDLFSQEGAEARCGFVGEGKRKNREKWEERFEVRFSISSAVMGKLEEAKSLLSGKYPEGVSCEAVFGEALNSSYFEHTSGRAASASIS